MLFPYLAIVSPIKNAYRYLCMVSLFAYLFFCYAVSHIVASCDRSNYCSRTFKFLCGIAGGKWIVNAKCKLLLLFLFDDGR